MAVIAVELTDDETARLDAICEEQKRARKNQAAILLMERVAEIESEKQHE